LDERFCFMEQRTGPRSGGASGLNEMLVGTLGCCHRSCSFCSHNRRSLCLGASGLDEKSVRTLGCRSRSRSLCRRNRRSLCCCEFDGGTLRFGLLGHCELCRFALSCNADS
jgi:hypothetical protein